MQTLVRLTSVQGVFAAHVLAARLVHEGVDAELRGPLLGTYAFTVGEMARIDVMVPFDQLDDALFVMLAVEIDWTLAAPSEWAGPRRSSGFRWVALAVLIAAVAAPCAQLARGWA